MNFDMEHDYDYLADFYKRETKVMMEHHFSNYMVVSFYKEVLKFNSLVDTPKDLSSLEELMCKYIIKEAKKDDFGFNIE